MNLESKNIVFEDIGRQLIAGGKRLSAKQLCDHIGMPHCCSYAGPNP